MKREKAEEIVKGFHKYILDNFKQADKLGYLKINIHAPMARNPKYRLVIDLGAGWGNTPWHDDLVRFIEVLSSRTVKKYPELYTEGCGCCGYTGGGSWVNHGGMIEERKLLNQMGYPDRG